MKGLILRFCKKLPWGFRSRCTFRAVQWAGAGAECVRENIPERAMVAGAMMHEISSAAPICPPCSPPPSGNSSQAKSAGASSSGSACLCLAAHLLNSW